MAESTSYDKKLSTTNIRNDIKILLVVFEKDIFKY